MLDLSALFWNSWQIMARNHYQQAKFLKSVADLKQLPPDQGIEVAFIGRSNAGKSSALNALSQQKRLAHVSKTPGRTQMINLFELDTDRRLVDLPGYGFAKVPLSVKQKWQQLLSQYLETRECLQGLILLMDIRHPLQDLDLQILQWAQAASLKSHILLTKADKLKKQAAQKQLQMVKNEIKAFTMTSIQLFSATKKTGVESCRLQLDSWYEYSVSQDD